MQIVGFFSASRRSSSASASYSASIRDASFGRPVGLGGSRYLTMVTGVYASLRAFLIIALKKIMQTNRRWGSKSPHRKTAAISIPTAALTPSRSSIAPWRVKIRALRPCEHEHFLRHLLRLDGVTRNERFGRGVSDDWITRYAAETDWLHGAVLGCWIDGTLRGAAELRRCESHGSRTGEAALSIESEFQSHGLGSLLARRIVSIARNRGIVTLSMVVAAGNQRMRSIVEKLGAPMTFAGGDQIDAELTLSPGTVVPIAEEWLKESAGAVKHAAIASASPLLKAPMSCCTAATGSPGDWVSFAATLASSTGTLSERQISVAKAGSPGDQVIPLGTWRSSPNAVERLCSPWLTGTGLPTSFGRDPHPRDFRF